MKNKLLCLLFDILISIAHRDNSLDLPIKVYDYFALNDNYKI